MSTRWSAQRAGFVLALRLLTPSLGITSLIVAAFALTGAWTQPINASDRMDTRVWWLQAAFAMLGIAMVVRAIDVSPQWGRERSDGQWLRRRGIGGADGTFVIAIALFLCLELAVIVLTPIFEFAVRHGRPSSVAERLAIEPAGFDRLDARHPRVEFPIPPTNLDEVELRPTLAAARMDASLECLIAVEQDGVSTGAPHAYGLGDTVLRIPLRSGCRVVALRRVDGDLALEFPAGSAHAIRAATAPRWIAGIGAASCLLFDWLPILALLCLMRRLLAVGVLKSLAIATHLALLIGGRGVQGAALSAHGRDAWFWNAHTQRTAGELVIASAVLVALTVLTERRSQETQRAPEPG